MIGWIILVIVVVVIGYAVLAYNNLVRQRQLTQEDAMEQMLRLFATALPTSARQLAMR